MDDVVSDPLSVLRDTYNMGKYQETVDLATKFLKDSPHAYSAWVLRGAALIQMDSHYSAILNFTKAISLNPGNYDAWNNRGLSYFRLCMWDEAIADFEKAIELSPDSYMPHFQLGLLYSATENSAAAEFHLRKASQFCLELDNNINIINMFLATLLQGTGQWQEGFRRDQYRYNHPKLKKKFIAPTWQGEDLAGKSMLLFTESGWGDKIQSLRYVNLLREKYPTASFIIGTQPDLASLIRSSFDLPVVIRNEPTDYAVSLIDIPMILKLEWNTVPRLEKYLKIDPEIVEGWKAKFEGLPAGINVGLCWASLNGVSKTINPWDMMELGGVPGVNFISLQKPYRTHPKNELKLHDWTESIHDWTDTGAIIENCDIVISIDTGVAHLAGALGKPIWNIVRFSTYWPWMAAHIPPTPEYSIWYPSMTLFRQKRYGDWLDTMRRVTLELQRQLAGLT